MFDIMNKIKLYLDDVRTPVDSSWTVVRNYTEFVEKVQQVGFDEIDCISLDHDLGDSAMDEYYTNVSPNYTLNYDNIQEKTGYDCAKWLVSYYINTKHLYDEWSFPAIYVHSANPIGAANIMGYINNFLMNSHKPQTCVRVKINHVI